MDAREQWVERILRVIDHVHSNLDEELNPDELASLAGFSRHHFHRVFRGMVGESAMGFVRRLRLERAAQRLKFGTSSVTEVAFDAGYGSHEAFTRAFRTRFGVAPSTYRQPLPDPTDHQVEMRTEPSRACIANRYVGPYSGCEVAWGALYSWAGPAGIPIDACESIGLCYDDPEVTDGDKLRYDACLVVPKERAEAVRSSLPPGMTVREIPPGRYAVTLHRGAYEKIDGAYYALLGRRLPTRGVELADDPVVERYLNSPFQTAPDDLLTEIAVRLHPIE